MVCLCDVCKQEVDEGGVIDFKIQVIASKNITDWGYVPYLSETKMDVCSKCFNRCLSGEYIFVDRSRFGLARSNFFFKGKK